MNDFIYDECVPFGQDDWDRIVGYLRDRLPSSAFYKLYRAEFIGPTPEQEREEAIAKEYHESCDACDKWTCSGISPRSGEPMPITPFEQGLISRHAQEVRRRIIAEYQLTDAEFHRIIVAYKRR